MSNTNHWILGYRHLRHRLPMRRLNVFSTTRCLVIMSLLIAPVGTLAQEKSSSNAQQPNGTQKAEYQEKIEAARQNIQKLQAELKQVIDSKSDLESKLSRNEKKLGELTKKIRDVEEALANEKKQLALLNEQRKGLVQSLSTQQSQLEKQLLSLYLQHRKGANLSLNISPAVRAKLPRLIHYQQILTAEQHQQLSTLKDKESALQQLTAKSESHRQALDQQIMQLASQKAVLEASQKERSALLSSLAKKAASRTQQLKQAKQEQEALSKVMAAIEKELARRKLAAQTTPFRKQKGKLNWPTAGNVIFSFGSPRQPVGEWDGVWIRSNPGSPVKSVHSGRVVFADWLRGFGLLVIVDHGDGFMSLYGHNQSLDVAIGDRISAHQTIAHVGNSGGKDDIGLYFAIRHKGKPQDPARWCS